MVSIHGQVLVVIIVVATPSQIRAAVDRPDDPETILIDSAALGETSSVRVWTPVGYERGSDRYAAVYCADHDRHSPRAAEIMRGLAADGVLPGLILVAIRSTIPVVTSRRRPARRTATPAAAATHGWTTCRTR